MYNSEIKKHTSMTLLMFNMNATTAFSSKKMTPALLISAGSKVLASQKMAIMIFIAAQTGAK